MQPREVPFFFARDRVDTIDAVVPCPEEDASARHARARFGMALCRKIPKLGAVLCVDAVQLALRILMKPFTDVEAAFGNARGGKDRLHLAARIEHPVLFAGMAVQAI